MHRILATRDQVLVSGHSIQDLSKSAGQESSMDARVEHGGPRPIPLP